MGEVVAFGNAVAVEPMNLEARREVETIVDRVRSMRVNDSDSQMTMTVVLQRVADARKRVTEFFAPLKQKAKAAHQEIVDAEKRFLEPLSEAEKHGKSELARYKDEQEREAREALARIELETGETVAVTIEQPKVAGVGTRKLWRWRVVDVNAIPREYMVPNDALIGSIVRERKDSTVIPGIEVYSETNVSIRRTT